MKKRSRIAAVLLALGVCLAFAVLALLPPRPGVTKANFDRIEIGMTEAEAVIGPLSEHVLRQERLNWRPLDFQGTTRYIVWGDVEGLAFIYLHDQNRVIGTT